MNTLSLDAIRKGFQLSGVPMSPNIKIGFIPKRDGGYCGIAAWRERFSTKQGLRQDLRFYWFRDRELKGQGTCYLDWEWKDGEEVCEPFASGKFMYFHELPQTLQQEFRKIGFSPD